MAAAVDEHDTIAGAGQRRNLMAPVAAMAEAAMQQDHRRAGPVCCIPDASAVVFDVSLTGWRRQGWCTIRCEFFEAVVSKFHIDLPIHTWCFEESPPLISRRR